MRAIVTGGAGFLGRAIAAALGADTLDLVPGATYQASILALPEGIFRGYDLVVHAAAPVGVALTEANPRLTMDVISRGTALVIDQARADGVERLIHVSSSEVLGRGPDFSEDAQPAPVSAYGAAKLLAEWRVRTSGLPRWMIVRLFNAYGPGQRAEFVIPRFVAAAREGRDLHCYGGGADVRAYCHVSDAAAQVGRLALNDLAYWRVINVGDDRAPLSVARLARRVVAAATGSRSRVVKLEGGGPERRGREEIRRRVPDLRRLRALIGDPVATISLEDGLARLCAAG